MKAVSLIEADVGGNISVRADDPLALAIHAMVKSWQKELRELWVNLVHYVFYILGINTGSFRIFVSSF